MVECRSSNNNNDANTPPNGGGASFERFVPIIILYIVGAYFLLDVKDFTPDALLYPRGLAILLMFFSTLLLFSVWRERKPMPQSDADGRKRFWITLISSCVYVALIFFIGYYISTLLFCFGLITALGHENKKLAFLVAVVMVLCVYLGFRVLLSIPVPEGILFSRLLLGMA